MILTKKMYDALKKYVEENGEILIGFDCGNDQTIIDFSKDTPYQEELYDILVDVYDLPNATGGYHVAGESFIKIIDEELCFVESFSEVDPEDCDNINIYIDFDDEEDKYLIHFKEHCPLLFEKITKIISKVKKGRNLEITFSQENDNDTIYTEMSDGSSFGNPYTLENLNLKYESFESDLEEELVDYFDLVAYETLEKMNNRRFESGEYVRGWLSALKVIIDSNKNCSLEVFIRLEEIVRHDDEVIIEVYEDEEIN